jgi:hypothetical protein
MTRTIIALLVLALFAALTHASPVRRQDSGNCTPVIFNSTIPAQLCASPDGSTVDSAETHFSWQGGNGRYNFFRTKSGGDEVRLASCALYSGCGHGGGRLLELIPSPSYTSTTRA